MVRLCCFHFQIVALMVLTVTKGFKIVSVASGIRTLCNINMFL